MKKVKSKSNIRMLGIDAHIHRKLIEIAESRKANNNLVKNMKDIVAESVTAIHKKECK